MRVLTDEQRARLLKALETAPDDVLCTAVSEMKRMRVQIQDDYKELSGFIGREETKLPEAPAKPAVVLNVVDASKGTETTLVLKATAPGIACSRIGKDTRDAILAKATSNVTLDDIMKHLKRGESKRDETVSALKLLYNRGELLYFSDNTYRRKS